MTHEQGGGEAAVRSDKIVKVSVAVKLNAEAAFVLSSPPLGLPRIGGEWQSNEAPEIVCVGGSYPGKRLQREMATRPVPASSGGGHLQECHPLERQGGAGSPPTSFRQREDHAQRGLVRLSLPLSLAPSPVPVPLLPLALLLHFLFYWGCLDRYRDPLIALPGLSYLRHASP